jgi:hypothetical protein
MSGMILERATFRLSLFLGALLLAGCAGLEERACDAHEERMRGVKPVTVYRAVDPAPGQTAPRVLPNGSVPMVTTYKLSFKPRFTKPCTSLDLLKDVTVQRSVETAVVLNEIREFYAEDGTLIASNSQDISAQVNRSGVYVATTPLPIPKAAPPGKYKIVSKLMYERRGNNRPAVQLARAEGFFYIIPRD